MTYQEYCAAERHNWVPTHSLRLAPHEECLVLRLRHGWTQAQTARAVGCSRYWVGLMERGAVPSDALRSFWGDR